MNTQLCLNLTDFVSLTASEILMGWNLNHSVNVWILKKLQISQKTFKNRITTIIEVEKSYNDFPTVLEPAIICLNDSYSDIK